MFMSTIKLPSQFQPLDTVGLQTLINLMERAGTGKITKVSFLPGKVKYDIEIPVMDRVDGEPTGHFRIANVDSVFLHPPIENGFHYNSDRDMESRNEAKKPLTSMANEPKAFEESAILNLQKPFSSVNYVKDKTKNADLSGSGKL